jgi:hypothetical protein
MAKGGRRYPLVIYTHMMDRWRPWIFGLGLALLGLAGVIFYWGMEQWRWVAIGSVGIFNMFASILMWIIRKSAYVQPFPDHLRLVTPFLRINISYKRFRRTSTANMGALFPPNKVSSAQVEILQHIAGMTVIVIELTSHPMSQSTLRFFLSPLFFKDKNPHFVILVDDWMRLSTELDSIRSSGGVIASQQQKRASSSILSRLPGKK